MSPIGVTACHPDGLVNLHSTRSDDCYLDGLRSCDRVTSCVTFATTLLSPAQVTRRTEKRECNFNSAAPRSEIRERNR